MLSCVLLIKDLVTISTMPSSHDMVLNIILRHNRVSSIGPLIYD